jgi:uncharacterized protein
MERQGLIIFVKAPGAAAVKSRLAKAIGEENARMLYRHFVADILETMGRGPFDVRLFFYPPDQQESVAAWLGRDRRCEPQHGNDLGERMSHAFRKVFAEGYDSLLLIGSDLPDLPAAVVEAGFAELRTHDCVIGPAMDGGYYLIGFKAAAFLPDAFMEIPWGSDGVCENTCRIIRAKALRLAILPCWRDIDTIEDLKGFIASRNGTSPAGTATLRFIESEKMLDCINGGAP